MICGQRSITSAAVRSAVSCGGSMITTFIFNYTAKRTVRLCAGANLQVNGVEVRLLVSNRSKQLVLAEWRRGMSLRFVPYNKHSSQRITRRMRWLEVYSWGLLWQPTELAEGMTAIGLISA
jgi:hypothetical protein